MDVRTSAAAVIAGTCTVLCILFIILFADAVFTSAPVSLDAQYDYTLMFALIAITWGAGASVFIIEAIKGE